MAEVAALREANDAEHAEMKGGAAEESAAAAQLFEEMQDEADAMRADIDKMEAQLTEFKSQINAANSLRRDSVSRAELDEQVRQAQEELSKLTAAFNKKLASQSLFRKSTMDANKTREERLQALEKQLERLKGREVGAKLLREQFEEKERERAALQKQVLKMEEKLQAQIDTILSARESEFQQRSEEQKLKTSLDDRVTELFNKVEAGNKAKKEREAAAAEAEKADELAFRNELRAELDAKLAEEKAEDLKEREAMEAKFEQKLAALRGELEGRLEAPDELVALVKNALEEDLNDRDYHAYEVFTAGDEKVKAQLSDEIEEVSAEQIQAEFYGAETQGEDTRVLRSRAFIALMRRLLLDLGEFASAVEDLASAAP